LRDAEGAERDHKRGDGGNELRRPVEAAGPRVQRLEDRVDSLSEPVQPAGRPASS
jgi:hypothetical protein